MAALVVLALSIWIIRSLVFWYRRTEIVREFRKQLQILAIDNLDTPRNRQEAIASISKLIKRYCVAIIGKGSVASLHGAAFLDLLDKMSASNQFSDGPGRLMLDGAYRPDSDGDVEALRKLALQKLTSRSVLRRAEKLAA